MSRSTDGVSTLHVQVPTLAGIRYQLRETVAFERWEDQGGSFVGTGREEELTVVTDKPAQFFEVVGTLEDTILSAVTGIEYPIHVLTPEGYDINQELYPVIYATDGQWITAGFSEAIQSKGKKVILVTIEQGPDDRRATDYVMPGAVDYYQFLVSELLPAVESVYRIDTADRAICGTSYGGLLVGSILFMDDVDTPHFKKYLSFDGSFYYRTSYLNMLEKQRFESSSNLKAILVLTSGTMYPNNDLSVTSFKAKLDARSYSGLEIHRLAFPVTHSQISQPSFESVLDLLY